jgi:hypothetical protein
MRILKLLTGGLLATLAIQPIAASAASSCLTPAEAQAIVRVALPDIIGGVSDKCKANLAGTSFILQSGPGMIARYRSSANAAWGAAKPAMTKIAGDQASFLANLPDDAVKPLLSALVSGEIGKGIKPEQCGKIDNLMAAVAPLPAENMADLVVAIAGLTAKEGKASKINICEAPASIPAPISRPTGSTASK